LVGPASVQWVETAAVAGMVRATRRRAASSLCSGASRIGHVTRELNQAVRLLCNVSRGSGDPGGRFLDGPDPKRTTVPGCAAPFLLFAILLPPSSCAENCFFRCQLLSYYFRRERLRKTQIATMAIIGIAKSRNSNDPEPPSGETPNILSMKSMSPPDISKLLAAN
jgi:hypothetical protein